MPNAAARLMACAVFAVIVCLFTAPADAEQRKLRHWTTSPIGSYGYTFVTSMTKLVDQALAGEYAVTVQPYPSTTIAMRE